MLKKITANQMSHQTAKPTVRGSHHWNRILSISPLFILVVLLSGCSPSNEIIQPWRVTELRIARANDGTPDHQNLSIFNYQVLALIEQGKPWNTDRVSKGNPASRVKLTFWGKGSVAGYDGCNTFEGRYFTKGPMIMLYQIVQTKKLCYLDLTDEFWNSMKGGYYFIEGQTLTIWNEFTMMRFR